MLDTVKVTFDNGDVIITDFNAQVSREEMAKYYMGNWFNFGIVSDDMHKAVKVEFPDSGGEAPLPQGHGNDDGDWFAGRTDVRGRCHQSR